MDVPTWTYDLKTKTCEQSVKPVDPPELETETRAKVAETGLPCVGIAVGGEVAGVWTLENDCWQ